MYMRNGPFALKVFGRVCIVAAMSSPPTSSSPSPLARPVRTLNGVGPEREAQLARLGLFTVEDLLLHRPRRYEDRRHFRTIAELPLDEAATTRGECGHARPKNLSRRAEIRV